MDVGYLGSMANGGGDTTADGGGGVDSMVDV